MNRIEQRFTKLRESRRTALIPFITAGDPLPEYVVTLLHALVKAGADLIELGVPFSDPMADGPVIQHASERALQHKVDMHKVLGWVRTFREQDDTTPIVLMGYLNPIEIYGDGFGLDAAACGVDGVLVVDCPIEETAVLQPLREAGLHTILLAAPTTEASRLARIAREARGYLYYVSFAGVTGAKRLQAETIANRVRQLRAQSRAPVAVGFGVRDADGARAIAEFADAVVIGSALVEQLAECQDIASLQACVERVLAPLHQALSHNKGVAP